MGKGGANQEDKLPLEDLSNKSKTKPLLFKQTFYNNHHDEGNYRENWAGHMCGTAMTELQSLFN